MLQGPQNHLILKGAIDLGIIISFFSSMIHTNENHESSNGEEPVQKTVPLSTPPPPVSGYAVAAGAQQNHVDGGPVSPPSSTAPPRMANHVSSVAPSIPSSLSRPVLIAGNGMDQSIQNNHLPG